MRKLPIVLLAASLASAAAQQPVPPPPAGSNWQHVQVLPAGTYVNVKATARHTSCTLKSVDADTLTCTRGKQKDIVFRRAEIKTIKLAHLGRSALAGAAIGVGTGAVLACGLPTDSCKSSGLGGAVAGVGIFAVGAVGTIVGYLTDFTRSIVYKAP